MTSDNNIGPWAYMRILRTARWRTDGSLAMRNEGEKSSQKLNDERACHGFFMLLYLDSRWAGIARQNTAENLWIVKIWKSSPSTVWYILQKDFLQSGRGVLLLWRALRAVRSLLRARVQWISVRKECIQSRRISSSMLYHTGETRARF